MLDKLKQILQKHNVFLSGGAGVGKSFLTHELKNSYKKSGKNVVALGSTALSAFNIGGCTLHSFFCLGRIQSVADLGIYDRKQREKLEKLNAFLKKLDLIIIDEISMVSAAVFDMIALRLGSSRFRGKILIVGDFFQLPPVAPKQSSLFSHSHYAFASFFWKELQLVNLKLSVPKRTSNALFYRHLSLLREGDWARIEVEYFKRFLISPAAFEGLDDDFTLLCGINKRANSINEQKLAKIPNPLFCIQAAEKINDEGLSKEQFDSWVQGLGILPQLQLKVGARVIFCINNFEQNYFNGEQGVVEEIADEEGCIKIRKNNHHTIILRPYTFLLEELGQDGGFITRASLTQYPLKLAYAITIHKSQGMSIEKLVCDIDHIFENGQLYVALSRATEPKNLKIVYSKPLEFEDYFMQALKMDDGVREFYEKNIFVDLENEGAMR